ncbi:hypothetical protein R3W88_026395 [Solanum pinnatisectum]|uniref:Uncharacterized protein n=1 Tax=Solanum pinnatisectum TaxID=50273 RepID=A0AAV9LDC6_9SOLN|nr:hypothetical protein R3W88_026395 [Solanum pinnatisectum]
MTHISDIKLIRTDTTLDLSQKAEKGMLYSIHKPRLLYCLSTLYFSFSTDVGRQILNIIPP